VTDGGSEAGAASTRRPAGGGRPERARDLSFWPRGFIAVVVVGTLLVLLVPPGATWWQHQLMASAESNIDLPAPCERTAERRDGEAIGIFVTPPALTVTYTCPGPSPAATREAADEALRAGGFALEYSWRERNFTDKGAVEASSWSGHGSHVLAVVEAGRIELTLGR
jgi:hypothetical protein